MTSYDLGRVVGDTGPVGPTGPTGDTGASCVRLWISNADSNYSNYTPNFRSYFNIPKSTISSFVDDVEVGDYIWFSIPCLLMHVNEIGSETVNGMCLFTAADACGIITVYNESGIFGVQGPNLAPGVTATISFEWEYVVEPNTLIFNVTTGRLMKTNDRARPGAISMGALKGTVSVSATGLYDLSTFVTQQYVDSTIQALDLSQVSF